jgi:hypothetical protein
MYQEKSGSPGGHTKRLSLSELSLRVCFVAQNLQSGLINSDQNSSIHRNGFRPVLGYVDDFQQNPLDTGTIDRVNVILTKRFILFFGMKCPFS